MSFTFRPATRDKVYTLIGIGGPSGSGKTYSALRLASGLIGDGKIALIDTEANRALHYADQFTFLHGALTAPFTSDRYLEAIQAAKAAGASVIIVDSMSHEHEGPGGILEQHEAELTRMAGTDWAKREKCKFTAWIKPKRSHNAFVNGVLQIQAHLIFCFRAKDKLMMVKGERGRTEPVSVGWQPICSDRFEYEMTAMMILPPASSGVPDYAASATKIQSQHRHIFAKGRQIDEGMGQALAAWAHGGQKTPVDAVKAALAPENAKDIRQLRAEGVEIAKTALNPDLTDDDIHAQRPEPETIDDLIGRTPPDAGRTETAQEAAATSGQFVVDLGASGNDSAAESHFLPVPQNAKGGSNWREWNEQAKAALAPLDADERISWAADNEPTLMAMKKVKGGPEAYDGLMKLINGEG